MKLLFARVQFMKKSTFRSNKKYFHSSFEYQTAGLFRDLDWIFIQKKVHEFALKHQIEVQSLVMMDTHLHLLISTFDQNQNFFCDELQKSIYQSQEACSFCEPIVNYSQYLNTYKYIYRNPIEAGLCKMAEDYPFSSLKILLGQCTAYCKIVDQLNLIQNPIHVLKWLNQSIDYKVSQLKLLRQASSFSI